MISNQNIFNNKVVISVFLIFTPYTFLYLMLYFMFLLSFAFSTNFIWSWLIMELIILLFIGMAYTLFYNSFSNLLVYFLVQAFSSFSLLIFYLYWLPFLFTISLMLKLSLFPFHSWFISSVYSFPNFVLFLASTLHKIPIFIILILYSIPLNFTVLWSSILITFFVAGFLILMTSDFRLLLVLSSVGNNSWLLISSFSGMVTFIIFVGVYFLSLLTLFFFLGSSSKPYVFDSKNSSSVSTFSLLVSFISLSGLPPFPLFFSKIYVLYSLFSYMQLASSLFLLVIFSRSFLLMGYLSILIKMLVYSYSRLARFVFSFKS